MLKGEGETGYKGGPKGDLYLPPFCNVSGKETIKVPKSKLKQYKKFLSNDSWSTPVKYKSI